MIKKKVKFILIRGVIQKKSWFLNLINRIFFIFFRNFIFSFESDNTVRNMIISRVVNPKHSVFDSLNYANFFNFGSTFYISGRCVYLNKTRNYDKVFEHSKVSLDIEEMEVFSVKKSQT